MSDVLVLAPEQLIAEIQTKLNANPHRPSYHHFAIAPDPTKPPAYTLIVGAGFSCGVVPLTRELMHETIGGYYYPDQDQSSMERPARVLQKYSASFWAEFNTAGEQKGLPTVAVAHRGLPIRRGLPIDVGEAYRMLFMYEGANALFAEHGPGQGKRFVNGFLRYVLDPGSEAGWGSTGRNDLNTAHIYLAKILEAQQSGRGWTGGAFCRTIFTTNFDTLLQVALQHVNLLYALTDRPERGFDHADFPNEESAIHLVYVHGSILRHNPASATDVLAGLARQNAKVLCDYLQSRDIITVGYSGWEDSLIWALRMCDGSESKVYWCGIDSEPSCQVASLARRKGGNVNYISLGAEGADGLMRLLYQALVCVR